MLGSVFSPYYAWARRRHGPRAVDPLDYCGLNVALYGRGHKRWSLTERGRSALSRDANYLAIGPSALRWDQDSLVIDIEEVGMPIPHRLRGRIRLYPEALANYQAPLDLAARHRWIPIAPRGHIKVEMARPRLEWTGTAYFDSNVGDEPLEHTFHGWDWSRASHRGGTSVLYQVEPRLGADSDHRRVETSRQLTRSRLRLGRPTPISGDNTDKGHVTGPGILSRTDEEDTKTGVMAARGEAKPGVNLALHFNRHGEVSAIEAPQWYPLPRTRVWRIPRGTRGDPGHPATLVETLEDTPFYARSVVASRLQGDAVKAIHESLSLDRFRQTWVKMLLPFRMPRTPT